MNRPIDGIDLDGLEWYKPIVDWWNAESEGSTEITNASLTAMGVPLDGKKHSNGDAIALTIGAGFHYYGQHLTNRHAVVGPPRPGTRTVLTRPGTNPVEIEPEPTVPTASKKQNSSSPTAQKKPTQNTLFDQAWAKVDTKVKVYHKGQLKDGKVSGRFSTGLDKSSVEKLNRSGEVHEFAIDKEVFDD